MVVVGGGMAGLYCTVLYCIVLYCVAAVVRSATWWWWAGAWPGSPPPGLSSLGTSRSGETVHSYLQGSMLPRLGFWDLHYSWILVVRVMVLEAGSRLGGRVHTLQVGSLLVVTINILHSSNMILSYCMW